MACPSRRADKDTSSGDMGRPGHQELKPNRDGPECFANEAGILLASMEKASPRAVNTLSRKSYGMDQDVLRKSIRTSRPKPISYSPPEHGPARMSLASFTAITNERSAAKAMEMSSRKALHKVCPELCLCLAGQTETSADGEKEKRIHNT